MKFYDKTSTGSVINRISGDTNTLQAFMLRISQEIIVQAFMLVGIIIIMFIKSVIIIESHQSFCLFPDI